MKYEKIQQLVRYIPFDDDYFNSVREDTEFIDSIQSKNIAKFIRSYYDVRFGWNFVKYLIRNKKNLPHIVDEPYIERAYNFERFGVPDPAIMQAIAFNAKECKEIDTILQSFLVIEDIDFKTIADQVGIYEDAVKAYEALFFNVIDRAEESAWLASIIYPESRFVEMSPTYVQDAGYQWLLKRSGYNNGLEAAAHFSGMRTAINTDMVNASQKMENALMINGYLLATNGFVNQREAQGIHHAKTIISAEKQGGNQSGPVDEATGELGEYIFDELNKYGIEVGHKRLEQRKLIESEKEE